MPFDSTDLRIPEIDPATYQARRAQAALMWLRIPPVEFDMRYFRSCALGWLATWELDGWYWDQQTGDPRCRVVAGYAKNDDPYAHAAMYFRTDRQSGRSLLWLGQVDGDISLSLAT